ncbi:MAG: GreA/GreB family elongation factor [Sphingomonadaceae bacterium]|nr:GreA/GreB family elongation factor [Sphingomonadaceae bacterium]
MSVAFRRESDDEHKEPRFELPIPPGPNLVTARGFAFTQAKVEQLEAEVASLEGEAAEAVRRDLRYWRTRLATAQLAPPPPPGEVGFGSRVRFRLGGKIRTVDIVGDDEAEPAADRLSFSSPLARALIGAGAGDLVDFGGRLDAIELLATEAIAQADSSSASG